MMKQFSSLQADCSLAGSRLVSSSMDIWLFLRQAMSAHRKTAQANSAVAASIVQLRGCASSRATPPAKISTTMSERNAAAVNASAAHTRSYSFFIRLSFADLLVDRVLGVGDLQRFVRLLARLPERGEIDVLHDGHAPGLELLLHLGLELEDAPRGLLARLVGLLDQDPLVLLRQRVEPLGAHHLEVDQHDVLRLVGEFQHLVEAPAGDVVVDQLDAVDRFLLQAGVHVAEGHGDRGRAERADRFLPDRRRRRADAQSLQVFRLADRLVGEKMAVALYPVERHHLEAEPARQLVQPLHYSGRLSP